VVTAYSFRRGPAWKAKERKREADETNVKKGRGGAGFYLFFGMITDMEARSRSSEPNYGGCV